MWAPDGVRMARARSRGDARESAPQVRQLEGRRVVFVTLSTGPPPPPPPPQLTTWVCCDACGKWRKVDALLGPTLPDTWKCEDNVDWKYNSCETAQEPSDDQDELEKCPKK